MQKRLGFGVLFDEYNESPFLFVRGAVRLQGFRISMPWGARQGEEGRELVEEFFEIAAATKLSKEMFEVVEETCHVPAAKDNFEKFSRKFNGQPEGTHSYKVTYLQIAFNSRAKYAIWLKNDPRDDDATAMRELLASELSIQARKTSNAWAIELRKEPHQKGHATLGIRSVEVIDSPLERKFSRHKHNR